MLFRSRETRPLFPVTNYRRIISHRYTQPSQSGQNWPRNDTRDNTGPRTLFSCTSHFPKSCSDSSVTWWPRNAIQPTDRSHYKEKDTRRERGSRWTRETDLSVTWISDRLASGDAARMELRMLRAYAAHTARNMGGNQRMRRYRREYQYQLEHFGSCLDFSTYA